MESKEQLKKLVTRFYKADEAEQILADISSADKIFATNPAPVPSASLLADIKINIENNLRVNTRKFYYHGWFKAAAVAAILMAAAIVGIKYIFVEHQDVSTEQVVSDRWISEQLFWDDGLEQEAIAYELESIERNLTAIEFSDAFDSAEYINESDGDSYLMNNEFWEG